MRTLCVSILAVLVIMLGAVSDAAANPKAAAVVQQLTQQVDASDKLGDTVKTFTKDKLLVLCTNPVFAKAVAAQNDKKLSLDDIKKTDAAWSAAEEELPIQKELMSNDCAKEIGKIAKELGVITEVFVMDNQGANVGQNALTSDYWQGDEPKWKNSYNDGKGGVDVGKVKLDKSTNQVDQKVSLPIIDSDGKVIGAICLGLNVDKLQ